MAAIKNSKALAALTHAALALPGVAAAEVQTDYLYSFYQEKDTPGSQTSSGQSVERYQIHSHMFRAVMPMGENTLGANLTYETMSGASPWWVQPDTNGKPVNVMSGASIRDERVDLQGTWSLPIEPFQAAFSLGYSAEDDYEALNGGAELELRDDERGLTWTGGLGYSDDQLKPEHGTSSPNVIDSESKSTLTLYGGAAMVLNAATVVQANINYQRGDGFLSDPYKLAWIGGSTVADSRPDGRQSWALSGKLRHHLASSNAAIHVDYRYFHDDWEIDAHTLEVAWHQVLPDQWRITPALRWYSQSQAFFYAPYYQAARSDGFASSDYRLSPYGAVSARLDVSKALENLALGAGVEWYDADGSYALKSVDVANPGLVEYLSFQARITYRF
ncbi:MAG TPA: DUF3570 domain-containing protein [Solimonas sp.]|nr:DUF3570 domain-containing protein [Solimonas sp.]